MNELTLETLEKRVRALEDEMQKAKGREQGNQGGWESVVGMFDDDETMRQIISEGKAIRDAEREEAKRELDP